MRTHSRLAHVVAVTAVLLLPLVANGCGSDSGSEPSPSATSGPVAGDLTLFAYEDGFVPGYIKGFKEQYPDVKLRASAYDSGDAAIAKLRAGFQADVINLCVEEDAEAAVKLGLVRPLDVSRIENWDRIFPGFLKLPGVTMPDGKHYMVPVDAGPTGLLYDRTKVKPAPTSFKDLFDPKWAGKVAMIDYPVTAIQIGALALGYTDPLHLTDEQLENVKNLFVEAKKNGQFRTFYQTDSDLVTLFKGHEVWLTPGGRGSALDIQREGEPVDFQMAEEGQILWTCGYGISSTCKNVDAAYALINYYLSPEAEAYEATHWHYMITNMDTLEVVDPQVRKDAGLDFAYDLGNAIPAAPPTEGYDKWIRAWQEVKRS
jgi:spermidine/putrescine transport system substrate-binding protein